MNRGREARLDNDFIVTVKIAEAAKRVMVDPLLRRKAFPVSRRKNFNFE